MGFNEVLKPAWTKRTSFLISVSKALPSIFAFLSASKISTNAKRGKEKIEEKKKSLREREERQKKSQFITKPGQRPRSPIPVQLADLSSPIWSSLTLLYIGQSFDSDQRLLLLTRADIYILR